MKQWPLVLLILIIQESVTLNGLLVKSHQGNYSVWIITILFIIMSMLDLVIGYVVGRFVKSAYNKGKVRSFASRWTRRFKLYIGKHGTKIYLLLLGYFSFPYLNSFIAAWLNIPFWESFWYIFIGNILFYATSLLIVLGVTSIVPNPYIAFLVVIVATLLVMLAMRIWRPRMLKKEEVIEKI